LTVTRLRACRSVMAVSHGRLPCRSDLITITQISIKAMIRGELARFPRATAAPMGVDRGPRAKKSIN
jgi:hypothetical protein